MKRFSATNLAAIREQRGLVPRQLAARLDIDPGEIRRYEKGKKNGGTVPGADRVAELAEALDVGIEALYETVTDQPSGRDRTVGQIGAELDAARRPRRSARPARGSRRKEER